MEIYPSRPGVFSSEFLDLPPKSPQLGNIVKFTFSRAGPIRFYSNIVPALLDVYFPVFPSKGFWCGSSKIPPEWRLYALGCHGES